MSFDYSTVVAAAQKLTKEYGREVRFRKIGGPSDPTKPWRGPVPPTVTPYQVAAVNSGSASKLGLNVDINDFVSKSDQIFLVATQDDLSGFDQVEDGGRIWTITGMTCLQPGPVRVLWYVGVGG